MSYTGKKTPLMLNAESQLTYNQGLRINPIAVGYQGVWQPDLPYNTPTTGSYSQGSVTGSTVLNLLTASLPNFYKLTPGSLTVAVWRNLIRIGSGVCPALGNSRPTEFKTTYPGYGSFKKNLMTDEYYNTKPITGLGLVEPTYPPQKYPASGVYSYIYNNWRSPSAGIDTHDYAWVTGWPGRYSWQSKSGGPQISINPDSNGDTYAAAYYPRPDLAPVQPWRARDANKIEYDEYFSNGFIATVARQAYYEFWSNYSTRRSNQYPEFLRSFQLYTGYQNSENKKVTSFDETKTFLKGNYSNINDLTTSDLAGVNLAFKQFGNDLIRLGKTLDLSQIHQFGLPSKFLLNLQNQNALTESLRLALLYSDLSTTDLTNILLPTYTPSIDQEKKIYNALTLISGQDLTNITITVNCTTPGLQTLADLINPMKMFPNSYGSLTIPEYNPDTLSSKNYDFIYSGSNVNTRIENWGTYLDGILPPDMALACGAFMMTMNQVKNIHQMNIEKLSQVVSNLEVTNKDLALVNSADGVPGSVALANQELALIALGSGSAGNYRFCDFLGAMSGLPYREYYKRAQDLILRLQTSTLDAIYLELYLLSTGEKTPPSGSLSEYVQSLIDAANANIASIAASNSGLVEQLNYWWDKIGNQLSIEQRAIALSVPMTDAVYMGAGRADIDSFIVNLEEYALNTGPGETGPVLDAISDLGDIGGQSIVAAQREARNAARLLNTGGEVDNDVPNEQNKCTATAEAIIGVNGTVESIKLTAPGCRYDLENPPNITILPQSGVFGTCTHVESALNISTDCKFIAAIQDYPTITKVEAGWTTGLGTVTSALLVGSTYEITVTGACFDPSTVYTFISPPCPPGQAATAQAVLDSNGSISSIKITNPGSGYCCPPTIIVENPPAPSRIGGAEVPGSLAGSEYTGQDPVPDNLVTDEGASYTVEKAIEEVTTCNCDCWK